MKLTKIRLKRRYQIILLFSFFIIVFITYIHYIEPSTLAVNEYNIASSNLPSNFHGLKIVHFSDLHYGRTILATELKKIVVEINNTKPDIVVFTGDLIDKEVPVTTSIKSLLKKELSTIKASLGKYAVFGNHDQDNLFFTDILTSSDFILLDNTFDLIYYKGLDPILIGGLNTNKEIDLDLLFLDETIDSPLYTIMLMHKPDFIDSLLLHKQPDLVLAGHSHNGQIKLPLLKPLLLPEGAKKYYKPYYYLNHTHLYISSGLGTTLIEARLFNKPSFNLYRLTKKGT